MNKGTSRREEEHTVCRLSVVFIVQSYAAVCEDVDTKACEILALKQPDLCSDPCLSKMCTRHCGHCRKYIL
jgi:hypothetical protein